MPSATPSNVPGAPSNTPVEHDEGIPVQPHYDDLLEVLPSATANRALGDPTFVPPNSPDFGGVDPANVIAGIEEMSLGSSRVRNERAYTLHDSAPNGQSADSHVEMNAEDLENGTVHDVVTQHGPEMGLEETISPGMSVHLRLRARDVMNLSTSVLNLASALETLTRALNALLHSEEMRAREEEEAQADAANAVENAITDHEDDAETKHGENGEDNDGHNDDGEQAA